MTAGSGIQPRASSLLLRSLAVGAVYAALHALIPAVLRAPGALLLQVDSALTWWLTGALLCLAAAPFILASSWSRRDTVLAVWAAIACVRSLGTGIEGSLFRPAETEAMILASLSDLAVGLLLAWLAVRLLMPAGPLSPVQAPPRRAWWGWAWRVLLVGLAYVLFYFVFGAANALLYTLSFYKNHPQYGLSLPPTGTIFLAQLIRGPLFGLGSLFIVRAANMPRTQTAIWLGLLLFVLGGLGPFVENVFRTMPLGFNLATLAELFLQNFSTGVVAALLYTQ